MKNIYPLLLLLFFISSAFAQSEADTIEVGKSMGIQFALRGVRLKPREVLAIVDHNEAARIEMKHAINNQYVGAGLGGIGGFLLGYSLTNTLLFSKPIWTMTGIGAGAVLLSIPFSVTFADHTPLVVMHYNNSLRPKTMNRIKINFG